MDAQHARLFQRTRLVRKNSYHKIIRQSNANQANKEMTKDANLHNEKSSQSRDLTRGRIGKRSEHRKFFLLVFLMIKICCK